MNGKARRPWRRAVLVTLTFLAAGALHDVYAGLSARRPSVRMTLWFVANGLALTLWDAAFPLTTPGARHWRRRLATGAALLTLLVALVGALP
jgi:hypothetical protein